MLHFDKVSLRRGPRLLFSGASWQIHPGQKAGLTGANGCGKSSLFALLLNDLATDSGSINLPADWVIAHLAQEVAATQQAALEYVLDGDAGLRTKQAALAEAEQQADGERIAHLHAELEHIGAYQASSRAAQLMHGLGFKSADAQRPLQDFSGGWRMRLNLAHTLMCRSDLLLLDEPTNHLDLDAVIWLEQWLKQYRGTLLLISHDRDFLDSVASHTLHIEQQQAKLYNGNYSAFERIRAEQLANQQTMRNKQQREIEHMRSFVERFRAKASKARQAQSRLKALQRMQLIASAHVDSPFHFSFKKPEKNPTPLLVLDQCSTGYADSTIIRQTDWELRPGDRIGLLGPNGAGKSTFIKLLAGELDPTQGRRIGAQDLKVGYFAQHQLDQLHPKHSPLEHLQQLDKTAGEQSLRDYLGGFGFIGDKALEKTAPFSGGEKSRLVLAILVYQCPNLLLLDEPTNHLDLEMRQALATALQDFSGAMAIVSHDRHLLRTCCDRLDLVYQQQVTTFDGDLDTYPAWLANREKATQANTHKTTDSRKARKRAEAEKRKQQQPLKRAFEKAEQSLHDLQQTQQALEQQLADNRLYGAGQKDQLNQLLQKKSEIDRAVENAEMDWLRALDILEGHSN